MLFVVCQLSLPRISTARATLVSISLTCSEKFNLSSVITPKYLAFVILRTEGERSVNEGERSKHNNYFYIQIQTFHRCKFLYF